MNRLLLAAAVLLSFVLVDGCHFGRARLLLRSISPGRMEWFAEEPHVRLNADAFIYGNHGLHEEKVSALKAAGKACLRYFNTTEVQPQAGREWRGAPWFDFLADSVMTGWGGHLVSAAGETAYYAFNERLGGKRALIDWTDIDSLRAERMARKMRELSPGCSCFLDVWFSAPSEWMFHPEGAGYEDFSSLTWIRWQANRERFLRIARRTFWKNGQHYLLKVPVILNGEWRPPAASQVGARPAGVYLEGAEQSTQGSWSSALVISLLSIWNPLSVRSHHVAWVDSAIGWWAEHGGTLAFTEGGCPECEDSAYARAWRRRQAIP